MGNKLNNDEVAETITDRQENQSEVAASEPSQPALEQGAPATASSSRWGSWKEIVDRISYQGIVRNMPYLMFLTVLCILYITNNNRAISLTRSINSKTKELKELRWRYMDIQSRLMFQTSETQLVPKAQTIGLQPLDKPAFEIKVKVPVKEEE
jgi:hypothetical protein